MCQLEKDKSNLENLDYQLKKLHGQRAVLEIISMALEEKDSWKLNLALEKLKDPIHDSLQQTLRKWPWEHPVLESYSNYSRVNRLKPKIILRLTVELNRLLPIKPAIGCV